MPLVQMVLIGIIAVVAFLAMLFATAERLRVPIMLGVVAPAIIQGLLLWLYVETRIRGTGSFLGLLLPVALSALIGVPLIVNSVVAARSKTKDKMWVLIRGCLAPALASAPLWFLW